MAKNNNFLTIILYLVIISCFSFLIYHSQKNIKEGMENLKDIKKDEDVILGSINTEYGLNYAYFDECFGINVDFNRKSYTEDNLKPQDTLTIMFSFKNVGSYRSTNLAVSEYDKQDISWESISVENDLFLLNLTPYMNILNVRSYHMRLSPSR